MAAGTAIVIAFTIAVPSLHGISTWKYVLGVIGFALFLLAGRDDSSRR